MFRTARITFTSDSFSFARCPEGVLHTLTATIWHVEGVSSKADTTRECRLALITALRGERALLVSWDLVPHTR